MSDMDWVVANLNAHCDETGHKAGYDPDLGPYCSTCAETNEDVTAGQLLGEYVKVMREIHAILSDAYGHAEASYEPQALAALALATEALDWVDDPPLAQDAVRQFISEEDVGATRLTGADDV